MRSFVLVSLLAVSSLAGAAELATRDFPAFTIALPNGEILRESSMSGTGSMGLRLDSLESMRQLVAGVDDARLLPVQARQVQVQWDTYPLNDEEERMVLESLVKALPLPDARIMRMNTLQRPRRFYVIGGSQLPMGIGIMTCDSGVSVTVTLAFTTDMEQLISAGERLVNSIVCKAITAPLQLPEPALRLPDNFGRKISEGTHMIMSTKGEMLVLGFAPQNLQKHPQLFQNFVTSLLSGFLEIPADKLSLDPIGKDVKEPPHGWTARLNTDGEMDGAYINFRYCEKQDLTMFGLWYAEENLGLPQAKLRLGQVGCPGEPSEPMRDLATVFGEACKKGDEFSCAMLEQVDSL